MLKRFPEIEVPINNTLNEFDMTAKCLTMDEITVIRNFSESLEIIEIGAIALCRREVSVLKSDKIFEYVLNKLSNKTGIISRKLLMTVDRRIELKRNKGICGLNLENPGNYELLPIYYL